MAAPAGTQTLRCGKGRFPSPCRGQSPGVRGVQASPLPACRCAALAPCTGGSFPPGDAGSPMDAVLLKHPEERPRGPCLAVALTLPASLSPQLPVLRERLLPLPLVQVPPHLHPQCRRLLLPGGTRQALRGKVMRASSPLLSQSCHDPLPYGEGFRRGQTALETFPTALPGVLGLPGKQRGKSGKCWWGEAVLLWKGCLGSRAQPRAL